MAHPNGVGSGLFRRYGQIHIRFSSQRSSRTPRVRALQFEDTASGPMSRCNTATKLTACWVDTTSPDNRVHRHKHRIGSIC